MRERLIELLSDAEREHLNYEMANKFCPFDDYKCHSEYIADYLLENGVVVLPCKVGEEVYYIIDGKIQELCVDHGTFGKIGFTMSARCKEEADMCEYSCFEGKTCGIGFDYSHIGKTVFLTREEAERALKGDEGK